MSNKKKKQKEVFTEFAKKLGCALIDYIDKKVRQPITYGEMAKNMNRNPRGCRCMSIPAGRLSAFCMKNGLPPITAILCNSKTNLPGSGFDEMFNENIPYKNYKDKLTKENKRETIEKLQHEVYNCADWSVLEDVIAN